MVETQKWPRERVRKSRAGHHRGVTCPRTHCKDCSKPGTKLGVRLVFLASYLKNPKTTVFSEKRALVVL
jgi:hypothetical protein